MWNTVRRWAGTLLAGALGGFTLLFAYWAAGGNWGLMAAMGDPGDPFRPPAWLMWPVALCLASWALIVTGATHEWGGPRIRAFLKLACWVIAVALFEVALGSFQGQEAWERLMFGPLVLLLSITAVVVALGLRRPRPTRRRMFL
jgi:Protein of unknown function (DUF3995)